ncbi:hypothetical protein GC098_14160 [Paenibacillus sp. LMG 31458]|uniref:ClpX-type ZB domain-containing protein n=1 Tax=Paenibacillus phytorum TaxID=2654977 RepID=A0ABX1XVK4_9BACL|nr:hypothetical protein [Paenibacillus phytorum]NOU72557.1 hypothetical protein [Paenibacillus phytorum]
MFSFVKTYGRGLNKAFTKLWEDWDSNHDDSIELCHAYPFECSLDELTIEVGNWRDVVETIGREPELIPVSESKCDCCGRLVAPQKLEPLILSDFDGNVCETCVELVRTGCQVLEQDDWLPGEK